MKLLVDGRVINFVNGNLGLIIILLNFGIQGHEIYLKKRSAVKLIKLLNPNGCSLLNFSMKKYYFCLVFNYNCIATKWREKRLRLTETVRELKQLL